MNDLWGTLIHPVPTFRSLAEKPRWVLAVLAWTLASLLAAECLIPRLDVGSMVRSQLAHGSQHMSDADVDRAAEMADRFKYITGFFFAGVAPAMIVAFSAGVLWLGLHAFGNETKYRPLFAMSAHALLPRAVAALASIPFILSTSNVDPREAGGIFPSNLGVLMNPIEHPVRAALLGSFDVFVVWSLALFVVGLSAVANLRARRALAVVAGLWAVAIACRVGFAAFGAMSR